MVIEAAGYIAQPLALSFSNMAEMADAAWKARLIVKKCSEHEAFFSDYMKDSEAAKVAVINTLSKPDCLLWEVWSIDVNVKSKLDLCGILRLSDLVAGCYAKAHYFFFDGRLSDKTPLLQEWKKWAFSPEGANLHRVTVEVPAYAKALGSHAAKRLGFQLEGTMKQAIKWRGEWHDIDIMGCIADG